MSLSNFECPTYKDFWSPKFLTKLNVKIDDFFNHNGRANCSYGKWKPEVIKDSGPILLINLSDNEEILSEIKSELGAIYDFSNFYLPSFYCGIHIFLKGSYIAWHTDENYHLVTTTYLNKETWDWNWGGAMIYENMQGGISALFPEYNKMIIQPPINHATTIVAHSAPPRISLQILIDSEETAQQKGHDLEKGHDFVKNLQQRMNDG